MIGIISKPSEYRQDEEVQLILGWFIDLFRKKSAVFGDIKSGKRILIFLIWTN